MTTGTETVYSNLAANIDRTDRLTKERVAEIEKMKSNGMPDDKVPVAAAALILKDIKDAIVQVVEECIAHAPSETGQARRDTHNAAVALLSVLLPLMKAQSNALAAYTPPEFQDLSDRFVSAVLELLHRSPLGSAEVVLATGRPHTAPSAHTIN